MDQHTHVIGASRRRNLNLKNPFLLVLSSLLPIVPSIWLQEDVHIDSALAL
jgi:hypothetical protein